MEKELINLSPEVDKKKSGAYQHGKFNARTPA
jgi:hypothetical protein